MNVHTRYKKIVASTMIVMMLASFTPQRAEAQLLSLDMSNLAANLPTMIKDFALDTASYAAARILSAQIINRITNFINDGFDDGNTFYVENQSRFMESVENIPLVQMSSELEGWESDLADKGIFTDTYIANMRASSERLAQNIGAQRQPTTLAEKLTPEYNTENFEEDITRGGWNAWNSYIEDNNNPLGRQKIIINDYVSKARQGRENTQRELDQSGGYLADKACEGVSSGSSQASGSVEKLFGTGTNNNVSALQNQIGDLENDISSVEGIDPNDPNLPSMRNDLADLQQQLNRAQRRAGLQEDTIDDVGGLATSISSSLMGMSDCPGMESVETPGAIIGGIIENAATSPLRQQEDVSELSQIIGGAIASYGNQLIDKGLSNLQSGNSSGGPGVAPLPAAKPDDSNENVDWLSAPYRMVDIEVELRDAIAKTAEQVAYLEKTVEIYRDFPLYLYTLDRCVPGPQFNWENRMRAIFEYLVETEQEKIRDWEHAPKGSGDNASESGMTWDQAFKEKANQLQTYLNRAIRNTKDMMNDPRYQILGNRTTRDAQTLLNRTMTFGRLNSEKQEELGEMRDLLARLRSLKANITDGRYDKIGTWEWNEQLEEVSNEIVGDWNDPDSLWPTSEQWDDMFTEGIDPNTNLLIHIKHFPNTPNHPEEGVWVDPRTRPTVDNCCGDNSNPNLLTPDDPGYYLSETDADYYEAIPIGAEDSNGIPAQTYQNPDDGKQATQATGERRSEQTAEIVARRQRLVEQFASYNQEVPVDNVIATARTEARDALNSLNEIALMTNECANVRIMAGQPDLRPEAMKRDWIEPTYENYTFNSRNIAIHPSNERVSIGYFGFELADTAAKVTSITLSFQTQGTHPANVIDELGFSYDGRGTISLFEGASNTAQWQSSGANTYTITLSDNGTDPSSGIYNFIFPGKQRTTLNVVLTTGSIPATETWRFGVENITMENASGQSIQLPSTDTGAVRVSTSSNPMTPWEDLSLNIYRPFPELSWTGTLGTALEQRTTGLQTFNQTMLDNPFRPFRARKTAQDAVSKLIPPGAEDVIYELQDRRLPWNYDVDTILARDTFNVLFCGYQEPPLWELSWRAVYPVDDGTYKNSDNGDTVDRFDWHGGLPPCLFEGTTFHGALNYTEVEELDTVFGDPEPTYPGAFWHETMIVTEGTNQWYNASIDDYERAFNQLNPANQIR